jgi:hypothetical protein
MDKEGDDLMKRFVLSLLIILVLIFAGVGLPAQTNTTAPPDCPELRAQIESLKKQIATLKGLRASPVLKQTMVCKDKKGRVRAAWSAGTEDPGPKPCGKDQTYVVRSGS